MTPQRAEDFTTKAKITLRDALLLIVGAATMWGTQIATQWKTQSSIDNLGTKFDGYVQKQTESNMEFQRQLDEVRRQANLGVITGNEAKMEAARLGGILIGSGIKGAQK